MTMPLIRDGSSFMLFKSFSNSFRPIPAQSIKIPDLAVQIAVQLPLELLLSTHTFKYDISPRAGRISQLFRLRRSRKSIKRIVKRKVIESRFCSENKSPRPLLFNTFCYRFLSISYPTSLLVSFPVLLSSVYYLYPYPSYLCLPLCSSFFVDSFLV